MFAIELSASIFCAREMRGMLSIASAVTPFAARRSSRSGILRRPEETDQHLALAEQVDFVGVPLRVSSGARTFRMMSLSAQSARVSATTVAPACRIRVVAEIRALAGAGFDRDGKAQLQELSDDVRRDRDPQLAGVDFSGTPMFMRVRSPQPGR